MNFNFQTPSSSAPASGSTSSTAPTFGGGLFGSLKADGAPKPSFSFDTKGSSSNTAQATSSSGGGLSLFGQASTTPSSTPAGSNPFAKASTTPATGGFFGAGAGAGDSNTPATGGLFGGSGNAATPTPKFSFGGGNKTAGEGTVASGAESATSATTASTTPAKPLILPSTTPAGLPPGLNASKTGGGSSTNLFANAGTQPTSNLFATAAAAPAATTTTTATSTTSGSQPETTAPAAGGGGLFGGAAAAGASNPFSLKPTAPAAAGGGLFGAAASSTTPAAAPSSNLFGAKPADSASTPGASSAAPAASTTATTSGNLFGGAAPAAKPGAGLFGAAASQPAATSSASTTAATTSSTAPAAAATTPNLGGLFGASKPAATMTAADKAADSSKAAAGTAAGTATAAATSSLGASTRGPPSQMARLKNKTMEDIVTRWAADLSKYQKEFKEQATIVSSWDRNLVDNGEKIQKLYLDTFEAERASHEIERQLAAVESQQEELEAWLGRYESEVQDMFAKQMGPGEQLGGPDQERERTYKLAEKLTQQLDEKSRDLSKMVKEINDISGNLHKGSKAEDPMSQIVRVLNGHLTQLQWIDANASALQAKVTAAQKSSSSLGSHYGGGESDTTESFYRSYMGRR